MLRLSSVCIKRTLLCTNGVCQNLAEFRFSHHARTLMNGPLGKTFIYNAQINKRPKIYAISLPRYKSTDTTSVTETASITNSDIPLQGTQKTLDVNDVVPSNSFISEIPEAPIPPSITEEIIETVKLHANGEPTFSSIGLGGYGPIGLLQYYFEFLHINLDMPWWGAILFTSFIIKVLTFPLAVDQQKNAHKLQNVGPELTTIQMKATNARLCGNHEEAILHSYELQELLKKHKVKLVPVSALLRIAIHLPVFVALRGMVTHPVESMKEGGLFWFTDLTIADPYYLLSVFATSTLILVTEYSFSKANAIHVTPLMRNVMRGAPLLSFVFTMHFQGAILCHWIVSNIMTVSQNIILQNKRVQKYFDIPPTIDHKDLSVKTPGVTQSFKDSWANMKLSSKLAQFQRADVMQFNEAGKGPLRKTYKYNPVKNLQNSRAISAMKK